MLTRRTSHLRPGRARAPRSLLSAVVTRFFRGLQGNLYAVLWNRPVARIVVRGYAARGGIEEHMPANRGNAERWLNRPWELMTGSRTP